MSIAHKVCVAGQWTMTEGTATNDTACQPCREGTFRAKAPKDGDAETEGQVCLPCTGASLFSDAPGLAACKTCARGESGVTATGALSGAHVRCADVTAPVVTLKGAAAVTVGQGLEYVDAGAVSDTKEVVKSTVCATAAIYFRNHTACSNCHIIVFA